MKTGDRVVSTSRWSNSKAGTIVKVGRGTTVMIRWDGTAASERTYIEEIRPETANDVKKRAHAAAMSAWREACPKTSIAMVEHGHSYSTSNEVRGAVIRTVTTPEDMRTAASELQLLAYWFAERPVQP